jgi:zinc/manganese transport system permease protein
MPVLEMLEITGPAVLAGLMISLTHAPLGLEVLKRGIIFIDLAIAQTAGLGVVLVSRMAAEPAWWLVQGAALACAMAAAFLFRLVERRLGDQQEAIIGCTFVVSATLALLLLADHPHGGEKIQHLLSGQILFVTWQTVLLQAPIFVAILWVWFLSPRVRDGGVFYFVFALAVTSSVQLAGVYVVFASLILPALAATVASSNAGKLAVASACGVVAVIMGIGLSLLYDLPSGPTMVIVFAVVTVLVRLRPLIPGARRCL